MTDAAGGPRPGLRRLAESRRDESPARAPGPGHRGGGGGRGRAREPEPALFSKLLLSSSLSLSGAAHIEGVAPSRPGGARAMPRLLRRRTQAGSRAGPRQRRRRVEPAADHSHHPSHHDDRAVTVARHHVIKVTRTSCRVMARHDLSPIMTRLQYNHDHHDLGDDPSHARRSRHCYRSSSGVGPTPIAAADTGGHAVASLAAGRLGLGSRARTGLP